MYKFNFNEQKKLIDKSIGGQNCLVIGKKLPIEETIEITPIRSRFNQVDNSYAILNNQDA